MTNSLWLEPAEETGADSIRIRHLLDENQRLREWIGAYRPTFATRDEWYSHWTYRALAGDPAPKTTWSTVRAGGPR